MSTPTRCCKPTFVDRRERRARLALERRNDARLALLTQRRTPSPTDTFRCVLSYAFAPERQVHDSDDDPDYSDDDPDYSDDEYDFTDDFVVPDTLEDRMDEIAALFEGM